MKFRTLFLTVIILALPMLLAACGGDKVGNAEKFMKAVADGDADEAEKYVCDDEKDSLTGESSGMPEGVEFNDISCKEDGDNVQCSFKMVINIEGADPQETEQSWTLQMDGDKVCGLETE
jgi:hypothetical protein